jgi:hypothetical protein
MTTKIKITTSTKFNEPSFEHPHPIVKEGGEGVQKLWRFKNGYGASVVRFFISNMFNPTRKEKIGSYGVNQGKWEMAVLKFEGDDYSICYDTKITSDVIGYLDEKQVELYLKKIQRLSFMEKTKQTTRKND